MIEEGKTNPVHTVADHVRGVFGAGLDKLKPSSEHLTDYVEWVVVHKACGKPLTGMSPQNGWCMCSMPKP